MANARGARRTKDLWQAESQVHGQPSTQQGIKARTVSWDKMIVDLVLLYALPVANRRAHWFQFTLEPSSQIIQLLLSLQGSYRPHIQYAQRKNDRDLRRQKLVVEMAALWKARLVKKFLDFVPGRKKKAPPLDLSGVPTGKGMEDAMYDMIEKNTNESGCIPNYEFVNTSAKTDAITGTRPDGILLKQGFKETKLSDDSGLSSKLNYMRYADIVFEMKPCDNQDGLNAVENDKDAEQHVPEIREHDTQHGMDTRAQLVEYATDIMSLQHRHCAYTVSFIGTVARIARWDRSGAVVSTAFDYADAKSNYLGEFLWRYVHASPAEQGFDDTVTEASSTDTQTFVTRVREYFDRLFVKDSPHRKMLEDTLDSRWPTCKMTVTDEKTQRETHYIIRRPFSEVLLPCGRSTRAYLAYSLELKNVVFLKDTWRTEDGGVPSEAEVYNTLHKLAIPHLPTVLASGDVKSGGQLQETLTDQISDLLDDDNNDNDGDDDGKASKNKANYSAILFRRHIHHRIVQDAALPIHFARSSKELVQAMRNVIETIWKAHRDGNLLHQDISTGNVMLNEQFEGLLNDWDHSVWVPLRHVPRNYRTGTWAFMSIELLVGLPKLHSLLDDIESCYWVLLFVASQYFEVQSGLIGAESNLFDEVDEGKDVEGRSIAVGGSKKIKHIGKGEFRRMIWLSKPLTRVIHRFAGLLQRYYHAKDSPFLQEGESDEHALAAMELARKQLENVENVLKIFDEAFASDDWPTNDISVGKPEMKTDLDKYTKKVANERNTRSTPSGVPILSAGSRRRDPATEVLEIARNPPRSRGGLNQNFSIGKKRSFPDEHNEGKEVTGPSDDTSRSKRAKKGKGVDRKPMTRARTRSQGRAPALPPSGSAEATRSRTNLVEGPRSSRSATRHNQQAPPGPVAMPPLRRSPRSQSRAADANNARPTVALPRSVTRSSSRNANASHENLPVARQGSRTCTRTRSANGRL